MKPRALRRPSFALAIAALAVASTALAGPDKPAPRARRAATADVFDKLAAGKLVVPSRVTMPKSIPATEKVEGFFIEASPNYGGRDDITYAQIARSKSDAEAAGRGETASGCFLTAYPNGGFGSSEVNWSGSSSAVTTVTNYKNARYGNGYDSAVQLVRSDYVTKKPDGGLDLEVRFAYVDASTLGARLHSSHKLEMSFLGELPGQVKVYGAKSEDAEEVTFLVEREKLEKERFFMGGIMTAVNGQHSGSTNDTCPVVFSLGANKGVTDSAVIQLEAVLEITEIKEEGGFLAQMPVRHQPEEGTGAREAKIRTMRIGFSSTWLTEDDHPVVSFSHGWIGKSRVQPI
jgi:hypothetical protein